MTDVTHPPPLGASLVRFLGSSVGSKVMVALTGMGLALFIVGHLAGNLLTFAGRDAFNAYAQGLRANPALLWVFRSLLLLGFPLHIVFSLRAARAAAAARPASYAYANKTPALLGARTMAISGVMVLAFLIYHLAHFTWHWTGPQPVAPLPTGAHDAYTMVVLGFQNPLISGVYILGQVLLSQHLSHGLYSMFQHLGLYGKSFGPTMKKVAPFIAYGITALFISIPVSVLAGVIKP